MSPSRTRRPDISLTWPTVLHDLSHAYGKRTPRDYIVKGLIPRRSLTILYGCPGSLKSALVVDLMVCVVKGKSWLEPAPWDSKKSIPFPVKQNNGVWIDFDNGEDRTNERIEGFGRGHDLPESARLHYYTMPNPSLDAGDPEQIDQLILLLKPFDYGLIVIDNLLTVSGGRDENSSEMALVMDGLRRLAEETGAAVIVIHHSRKESAGGKKGNSGDGLRGHSSINGSVDYALKVEREKNTDTVKVYATKIRGADIKAFSAYFTYTHKPGSDELETAQFYGILIDHPNSDKAIEGEIFKILGALLPGVTETQLNLATKVKANMGNLPGTGINNIKAIIGSMGLRGLIKVKAGKPGTAYEYSL